jgi:hypothetical protein
LPAWPGSWGRLTSTCTPSAAAVERITKVTPAHIYTAFKWLKWPLTVKDFSQPLRQLKSDQLFGSSEKGTYTVNHVGLQRVAELKIAGAA